MPLGIDHHLAAIRAIGESTRLRIVALLQQGELSVSDLTDILGQSQPRISRHLRSLVDADVVERHREGNFVFFSLTRALRPLVDDILAHLDPGDNVLAADADALAELRRRRTDTSQAYFADLADDWDEVRSLHAPDEIVEAAVLDTIASRPYHRLLDIGTGTGRIIQLLAGSTAPSSPERVAGLDSSAQMLAVARSNLAEIGSVELRHGDVHHPPFPAESFDLIVIHQVLHFLDDPDRAVAAVAPLLTPGGRLVIVDFAPHSLRFLQSDHAHKRLGFQTTSVDTWLADGGLEPTETRRIGTDDDRLTVCIWTGERPDGTTTITSPKLLETTP